MQDRGRKYRAWVYVRDKMQTFLLEGADPPAALFSITTRDGIRSKCIAEKHLNSGFTEDYLQAEMPMPAVHHSRLNPRRLAARPPGRSSSSALC